MERSPHRLFVFDTETRRHVDGEREIHQLRLWCSQTVQRHGRRPSRPTVVCHEATTAEVLALTMEEACRSTETLWAFAHNLGFDLATTRLPLLLQQRGWTITAHALTTATPWARLVRGSHRLVLADSTSWLPGPLAGIGDQVQIVKPELPDDDDDQAALWFRCRQDVAILSAALVQLMDWWDRDKRGSWSITGPQTGFNAMRHIPNPHKVAIDPDPDGRAFERSAITAGRREVWRVGQLPWGDYREVDFRLAHATIAASCPLPKRRSVRFDSMALDDWRLLSDRWAPIARCVVTPRTPRYPLEVGGRLFYPIGRFSTVLAGPELREAASRGELESVGPGYVYQLGQHMGEWGRWVLAELDEPREQTPAVARTAIKAWSRTVPGKWAGRTGRSWHEGPSAEQGWTLEHGRHHPSGARCAVLDMAGRREIVLQDQDAEDAFPAVLAWIQSWVRICLGRLIDAIGPERMISCNTDGIVVEAGPAWNLHLLERDTWPLFAREKARYHQLDVISPQHIVLDQERRLSGVPASADEVAPHQYRWVTWPRLPSQIAEGDVRGYVRTPRTADLRSVPVNRWVLSDGRCLPVRAEIGPDGENRLQPIYAGLVATRAEMLPGPQHPVLEQLLG